MLTLEQSIISEVHSLDAENQQRVLDYIRSLKALYTRPYTATQLLALPPEERHQIMAAALAASADKDFEIFEAYSEELLDD